MHQCRRRSRPAAAYARAYAACTSATRRCTGAGRDRRHRIRCSTEQIATVARRARAGAARRAGLARREAARGRGAREEPQGAVRRRARIHHQGVNQQLGISADAAAGVDTADPATTSVARRSIAPPPSRRQRADAADQPRDSDGSPVAAPRARRALRRPRSARRSARSSRQTRQASGAVPLGIGARRRRRARRRPRWSQARAGTRRRSAPPAPAACGAA